MLGDIYRFCRGVIFGRVAGRGPTLTVRRRPEGSSFDVVFVHGIDGDGSGTWGFDRGENWITWLGKSLPTATFWTLDYEVASLAWRGNAMLLSDRAGNVLSILHNKSLGDRPIVFVCHSFGGLLVKQVLRHSKELHQHEEIFKNTKGVVFLSTPHLGSSLADAVTYLAFFLSPTVATKQLEAHGKELLTLNHWYRRNANAEGIESKVFYELHPTRGRIVVDAASADLGFGIAPTQVDHDHNTIARPDRDDDVVVEGTGRFIGSCVGMKPVDLASAASVAFKPDLPVKAKSLFVPAAAAVAIAALVCAFVIGQPILSRWLAEPKNATGETSTITTGINMRDAEEEKRKINEALVEVFKGVQKSFEAKDKEAKDKRLKDQEAKATAGPGAMFDGAKAGAATAREPAGREKEVKTKEMGAKPTGILSIPVKITTDLVELNVGDTLPAKKLGIKIALEDVRDQKATLRVAGKRYTLGVGQSIELPIPNRSCKLVMGFVHPQGLLLFGRGWASFNVECSAVDLN